MSNDKTYKTVHKSESDSDSDNNNDIKQNYDSEHSIHSISNEEKENIININNINEGNNNDNITKNEGNKTIFKSNSMKHTKLINSNSSNDIYEPINLNDNDQMQLQTTTIRLDTINSTNNVVVDDNLDDNELKRKKYNIKHLCVDDIYKNGHLCTFLGSILLWILFMCSFITEKLIFVIIFIFVYIVYLVECYINPSWKDFVSKFGTKKKSQYNINNEICTVKLLDELREEKPILNWKIENYHFNESYKLVNATKNTILYFNYNNQNNENGLKLKQIGFNVKYINDENQLKINLYNNNNNNKLNNNIICFIVPLNYDGTKIIHEIKRELHGPLTSLQDIHTDVEYTQNGLLIPPFFRNESNTNTLLQQMLQKGLIIKTRKKIITNTVDNTYDYNTWKDISCNCPEFNKQLTWLTMDKKYIFSNPKTRRDHHEKVKKFKNNNNNDKYYKFYEELNINGYKQKLLIKLNENKNPCWMTVHGYWLFSIFMLSFVPRIKISNVLGYAKWEIIKEISI